MGKTPEDKIRYKVYSFRLHEGTYEMIKEAKYSTEMSYNRLLFRAMQEFLSNNTDENGRMLD